MWLPEKKDAGKESNQAKEGKTKTKEKGIGIAAKKDAGQVIMRETMKAKEKQDGNA